MVVLFSVLSKECFFFVHSKAYTTLSMITLFVCPSLTLLLFVVYVCVYVCLVSSMCVRMCI